MAESQKSQESPTREPGEPHGEPQEGRRGLFAVEDDRKAPGAEGPPAAPVVESPSPAPTPEPEKRSHGLTYLLLLLLAGAVIAAAVQTQRHGAAVERITALGDRIVGLEVELSAANLQLQTYEMQRSQVGEAVDDIAERVTLLQELVATDPTEGETLPPDPEAP